MVKFREMAVSGKFYPASEFILQKEFIKFLSEHSSPIKPDSCVRALIMPHAGYSFSGPTAVRTIAAASHGRYKRILIISPSHYVRFSGIALPNYEVAKTPFGEIDLCLDELKRINNTLYLRILDRSFQYLKLLYFLVYSCLK